MSEGLSARFLINEDGTEFGQDLEAVRATLAALGNIERKEYRDANAGAIAEHAANRILIVAGPGAGKSFLFMARIRHWLTASPASRVYVATFVRKLVKDLETEVSTKVATNQQSQVSVSTLHTLARSLVERAHGTFDRSFRPHLQIISEAWAGMVWQDVMQFHTNLSSRHYSRKSFEAHLHADELTGEREWTSVFDTYHRLSGFYNAVGFADLIVLARQVAEECPELVEHDLWIIDEYQDFNPAEDHLIRELTVRAEAVVLAGDDEQALYQTLKLSSPEIICSYYSGTEFANAMLPFCSRCSYHVCLAASAFIAQHRTLSAITKIYLPLAVDPEKPKVQVVATNTPSAALDYIQRFVEEHETELAAHVAKMETGEESDPFLLILTPDKKIKFYRTNDIDKKLIAFLDQWKPIDTSRSLDYQTVLAYCRSAWDTDDNFAYRKVLDHEGVAVETIHKWILYALDNDCSLASVPVDENLRFGEKCTEVFHVLSDGTVDAAEQVERLGNLIRLNNLSDLAAEIDDHPIGAAVGALDEEAEEAIQTAGALAAVELLSIVGSKGLSAHHVMILGCDDVNLAKTSALSFFVGITRARESLHVIASMKAGGGTGIHPFVLSLPQENCDYVVYKKTGRVIERMRDGAALELRAATWRRAARKRGF